MNDITIFCICIPLPGQGGSLSACTPGCSLRATLSGPAGPALPLLAKKQ